MSRASILNAFRALCEDGMLKDVVVPVTYYGNQFRMCNFYMEQLAFGSVLLVEQYMYHDGEWEECNLEGAVPLSEYDTEYLELMYSSLLGIAIMDKNLF